MNNVEISGQLAIVKRILRTIRSKRTRVQNEMQGVAAHTPREYNELKGQELAYSEMITYLKPMVEDLTDNLDYAERVEIEEDDDI